MDLDVKRRLSLMRVVCHRKLLRKMESFDNSNYASKVVQLLFKLNNCREAFKAFKANPEVK